MICRFRRISTGLTDVSAKHAGVRGGVCERSEQGQQEETERL